MLSLHVSGHRKSHPLELVLEVLDRLAAARLHVRERELTQLLRGAGSAFAFRFVEPLASLHLPLGPLTLPLLERVQPALARVLIVERRPFPETMQTLGHGGACWVQVTASGDRPL